MKIVLIIISILVAGAIAWVAGVAVYRHFHPPFIPPGQRQIPTSSILTGEITRRV